MVALGGNPQWYVGAGGQLDWTPNVSSTGPYTITASLAPLKPSRDYFQTPEADAATPPTFEADGRVFGHLALWETCHTGFLNGGLSECVKAPRSQTDYSYFHVGSLETEEGDMLPVGRLVYGGSHAPLSAGLQAASQHYDKTASVGAFVRVSNGRLGPWVSGVVRSDLSPEGLRDMRANPLSGDWRVVNHNLELIAALAVPVPGFPIPRSQLSLAASANGEVEVESLILSSPCGCEEDALVAASRATKSYQRRRRSLSAAILDTRQGSGSPV